MYSRKGYYIVILILATCLLIDTCLNVSYYLKNKRYQYYINETVEKSFKTMTSSIVDADVLLDYIVEQKTITKEQTDQLYFEYHEFAFAVEELNEVYKMLKDEQGAFNEINEFHLEMYSFFENLKVQMEKNGQVVRKMDSNELKYYKRMFSYTEAYAEVLRKYKDVKLVVSEDEWIVLLKEFANIDNLSSTKRSSLSI